jgi:glycosyltransferase involved in cell wall biosynthesis
MKNSQGKVSMVSPCYNKVKYIGKMLDSVIAQEWDNIELILVNDGSTDGTREIIADYEPKLKRRGYEVVIVDQENAGCCAAVYTGLTRMTGAYFCLVDCDDWLDPKYVSHLANWLDTHPDCDVAACNYAVNKDGVIGNASKYPYKIGGDKLLEKWILRQVITQVWIYMSRISYLKRCGLIGNWKTDRNKTYEPLIAVPLMSGGGKFEFFDEPLYIYNQDDGSGLFISGQGSREVITEYYDDYKIQYRHSLGKSNLPEEDKAYLNKLVDVAYRREILAQLQANSKEYKEHYFEICTNLVNAANDLTGGGYMTPKYAEFGNFQLFYKFICDKILNGQNESSRVSGIVEKPVRKVIVVAALGQAAEKYLGKLSTTRFRPTELWDNDGDGVIVKETPDVMPGFSEDDTVFCFSRKPEITAYYKELFADGKADLLFADDADKLLSLLKFMPKGIAQ